ncbi:MAG: ATP-binding protein [Vicinamibacterales bacterium]
MSEDRRGRATEAALLLALARLERLAVRLDPASPIAADLAGARDALERALRAACGADPVHGIDQPAGTVPESGTGPGGRSLNDAVSAALARVRGVAGDALNVDVDLSPDAAVSGVVPPMFDDVLVALAANARDAAGVGGQLTIATRRDLSGDGVRLEVSDNGPGLSPHVQARVFDPFYTTRPPGMGRGLGLSKARAIVEAAGGALEVRSTLGAGATFVVWLPLPAGSRARSA